MNISWLQRQAKDLPTPQMVVVAGPAWERYPACYYLPHKSEILLNGRYIPLTNGLVVVSESVFDESIGGVASTLAHEWRHHWQHFNFKHRTCVKPFDYSISYREAIVRFYRNHKELDALLFSHRTAPDELTRLWISWVKESHYKAPAL
jgi:hypothetical protein